MRRLRVIGIGPGDPLLVTVQAADAIEGCDVFLLLDKGEAKDGLAEVRREVLRRHATMRPYRTIHIADPMRDPDLPYAEAVGRWHAARVALIEQALAEQVAPGECVGILVWGDPALYDSTLRIVDQLVARGNVALDHDVIPGISSLQLLAARHRIPLNRVGRSVHLTTGRLLRAGLPKGIDDVVVFLDGEGSFTTLVGQGWEIFWGADLGSHDEVLIAGALDEVCDEIVAARARLRARKGWIFDVYLLRWQGA